MNKKKCCQFSNAHPSTWVQPAQLGALATDSSDGSPDGWTVAYYLDKTKAYEGRFSQGQPEGWWVFYRPEGQVAAVHLFEQGEIMRCLDRGMNIAKPAAANPLAGLLQAA
jgi:hypothetical protein